MDCAGQNYSVPYETHGIESIQNTNFDNYFGARVAQSAAGLSRRLGRAVHRLSLGGKANHAPGYYKPSYTELCAKIGFRLRLKPKTVFNAGAASFTIKL